MGVAMIAYVVPSKSPHSLLLSNGVARSYNSLIAGTGRTIEQFRAYCQGSDLECQVKDVGAQVKDVGAQANCSRTVHRDAVRKAVNVKLLELLSKFSTELSSCRT